MLVGLDGKTETNVRETYRRVPVLRWLRQVVPSGDIKVVPMFLSNGVIRSSVIVGFNL